MPKTAIAVALLMWTTSTLTLAAVRDLTAQPLAPGVFGIRWEINGEPKSLRLERRVGSAGEFESVGAYAADHREAIDRCEAGRDQPVEYRLVEVTADGKDGSSRQATARNSAELFFDGDFERVGDPGAISGLSVSASGAWTASIADGGLPPGRKCLQFSTTDPAAKPTFSASSRWFAVTPKTRYQFSWWMTESPDRASSGEGQAYGMTKEHTKSYYEKTASLYVEKVTRQGEWAGSWCEPRLPQDVRYVYFVLKGSGQGHRRPVRFDNVSILDTDIDLLLQADASRLVEEVKERAQRHDAIGLAEESRRLARTIAEKQLALRSPQLQEIDLFLNTRAELCAAIRQMRRLASVLRLVELKASAGDAE